MRRREFLGVVGGAAAWPVAARAQQPAIPVIGFLLSGSPEADAFRVEAVRHGLKEAGYLEGQNIAIEYRWAEDHYDRLPAMAADLVRRQVLVLVAIGNAAATAAKRVTAIIPVVFEVGFDPVEYGLVTSLARPGDNVTGVTFLGAELTSKQLEVLHEAVPKAAVIGMLENPNNPNAEAVRRAGAKIYHRKCRHRKRNRSGYCAAGATADRRPPGSHRRTFQRPAKAARRPCGALRSARDIPLARFSRGRRTDELRREPARRATADRRLCRPHS